MLHEEDAFTQRRQLSLEETEAVGKMVLDGQRRKGQGASAQPQPSHFSKEPDELREDRRGARRWGSKIIKEPARGGGHVQFAGPHRKSLEDGEDLNFGSILNGCDVPKTKKMEQMAQVPLPAKTLTIFAFKH